MLFGPREKPEIARKQSSRSILSTALSVYKEWRKTHLTQQAKFKH